jgi:hypothetical protein
MASPFLIPDPASGEMGWSGTLGGWAHDRVLGSLGWVIADVAVERM